MRVLLVSGSLRAGSTNTALVRTAAAVAPAGVDAEVYEAIASLPHFNPDDHREPLDPAVADLRARLCTADAVLFCTPEYAGALPGPFKNLLDWSVGGGETYGKAVAWVKNRTPPTPAAPAGGAGAHDSLRAVLCYTGSRIVEEACARIPLTRQAVGEDGLIADPTVCARRSSRCWPRWPRPPTAGEPRSASRALGLGPFPIPQTQDADHLVVADVDVAALTGEPHMATVGARPRVRVRSAVGRPDRHRLDPARAAPWRGDRSPLATL